MSENVGKWLGWIGIILGVIGFFWQPIWMGVIAIVAGVIGIVLSSEKIKLGSNCSRCSCLNNWDSIVKHYFYYYKVKDEKLYTFLR